VDRSLFFSPGLSVRGKGRICPGRNTVKNRCNWIGPLELVIPGVHSVAVGSSSSASLAPPGPRPAPACARCAHPARPAGPAAARSPCATRRSPLQARQPHQARRACRAQAAHGQSWPSVGNTTLQVGRSREFTTGSRLHWYLTGYGKGSPGARERDRQGARGARLNREGAWLLQAAPLA
jgi:hypothetical protein